ncbi:MAG: LUD domain-containing protein, partial [Candidatus Deferrimicrobium sp.]|nr:LUD domain-containing protein [Candidatus Deferrimicrobium sp.]
MSDANRERLFLENAAIAAAGTHSVSDTGELLAALGRVVAIDSPVYCPGVTELEKAASPLFAVRAADYAAAAVTVEEVFGAIAETGTIVCVSAGGRAVQAGLLPAHHVAIVRRERIFDTLDDLFAAVSADPPTNITLVTGPSRTADIEL